MNLAAAPVTCFMRNQPPSILLASADSRLTGVMREACRGVGEEQEVAADLPRLLVAVKRHSPDLLLVDFDLPGLEGPEPLRKIHQNHPEMQILAISDAAEPKALVTLLKAGARGYCPRDISEVPLRKAVSAILDGELWIERALVDSVIAELNSPPDGGGRLGTATDRPDLSQLTPREREIADLVARGLTHKAIAEELGISTNTIRNHLRHIFDKLEICDRLQLALIVRGHNDLAR